MKKILKVPPKVLIIVVVGLIISAAAIVTAYIVGTRFIKRAETNLKFGFVTDFEFAHRRKIGNKLSSQAPGELQKIVQYFNSEFKPEVVFEGGDMIESSTPKTIEKAASQLLEINEVFSQLVARKEYVLGNHDLRMLNKEQFRNALGMMDNHKYFDLGEWRFVVMDTNFDSKGNDMGPTFYAGAFVSEKEMLWLEEALATKRPVVIVSHHPPFPQSGKNIINGDKLRNIFEKHENIVLVISGHDPNFEFNSVDGTNYLIVDNLANADSVGSFATFEAKYNNYTKEASIDVQHYGPARKSLEINKKLGEGFNFWRLFNREKIENF